MTSSRGNFSVTSRKTSLATSCSNTLTACRRSLVATQLQAGSSIIATTRATLIRTSSTTAAQPWMPLQGPASAGRPYTPAFEELVCEVTVVLWSSEGPTSDSTSAIQTRGPRGCSRQRLPLGTHAVLLDDLGRRIARRAARLRVWLDGLQSTGAGRVRCITRRTLGVMGRYQVRTSTLARGSRVYKRRCED
jgi:hypothetical protein